MIDKKLIGKRINQVRIERDLTQEEFAQQLEVKRSAISQLENGMVAPSLELLNKLSTTFNISLDWLINGISSNFFKHSIIVESYGKKLTDIPPTLTQTMLPTTEETIAFLETLIEQKKAELAQSEEIIQQLENKKQLNSQELQTLKKLIELLKKNNNE